MTDKEHEQQPERKRTSIEELDKIYDETPLFKVHHKKGNKVTEMMLELGMITDAEIEE